MKQITLLNKFLIFLTRYGLQHPSPFAVAVSGGIDSVVLCELCKQAMINFFIVHCNFQLRGAESERDEEFVMGLAGKYGIEVLVIKFETEVFARENKLSIQEAARILRYQWFLQLYQEKKVSFTLLGHHANDNIETALMNFLRGSGLKGLTGMPEYQSMGHCLRPLLNCTRKEIEDFAGQNQLQWVEDSSNKLDKYTRNFLRNKLLPEVRDIFPSVEENILNNIERFRKTEVLYEELITRYKRKIGRHMPSGAYHLPVTWLQSKKDSSLIYEIIKDYGFTEKTVIEVIKLMDSESGRYISNESYKIIKHGKWLIIASNVSLYDPVTIEENSHKILFDANLQLEIKKLAIEKFQDDKDPNLVQLDARFIEWPLLLRKWKQGDYFYPLGMKKKKKVARFLIDHKISKDEKEKVWVIESGKRIICIVGMRLDDRFKITNTTKNILRITLSSL